MSGIPLIDPIQITKDYQSTNFKDPKFFSSTLSYMDRETFEDCRDQFEGLPVRIGKRVVGKVEKVEWNEKDKAVVGVISFDKENNPWSFKGIEKGYITELEDAIDVPGYGSMTMGVTRQISPPDFLKDDVWPIRQDITVLPSDDPEKYKLDFVVYEYIGCEIFPITEEMIGWPEQKLCDSRMWDRDENGVLLYQKPITKKEGLYAGMQVLVKTIFDYHWAIATVTMSLDGSFRAEIESYYYILEFGGDDRNCWVASCCVNKEAIKKVTFSS